MSYSRLYRLVGVFGSGIQHPKACIHIMRRSLCTANDERLTKSGPPLANAPPRNIPHANAQARDNQSSTDDAAASRPPNDDKLASRRFVAPPPRRLDHRILHVNGLDWITGRRQLLEHFRQFGPIIRTHISFNAETGLSRGFGYVVFRYDESYTKALEYQQHIIDKRRVSLEVVADDRARQAQARRTRPKDDEKRPQDDEERPQDDMD